MWFCTSKLLEYQESEVYLEDLDKSKVPIIHVPFNFSQEPNGEAINTLFYYSWDNYDPPHYPNGKFLQRVYTDCDWLFYYTAYEFKKISFGSNEFEFTVQYNYSLSRGRDLPGAISLITSAIASLIPQPKAVMKFCKLQQQGWSFKANPSNTEELMFKFKHTVGIKKAPQRDDSNDFDLASVAGGKSHAVNSCFWNLLIVTPKKDCFTHSSCISSYLCLYQ